jgi:hypothetical protein
MPLRLDELPGNHQPSTAQESLENLTQRRKAKREKSLGEA